MIRAVALLALLLAGGAIGAQTPTVRLDDPGLGPGAALLTQALAAPHRVIGPGPTQVQLPRDSVYRQTVIVLGRETVLDGTVEGDLIVVGGDLHLHPRSVVTGRAVAIGGGVYESTMSRVGSTVAFRDFTYEIAEVPGGYALRYRSFFDRPLSTVSWPGLYGLRAPEYDRTNGVSLTAGPLIAVPKTRLLVEPRLTYRSQLGRLDAAGAIAIPASSRTTIRVSLERNTFSNEDWIWPDLMNSLATLLIGHDARNHFRATRLQGSVSRRWVWDALELEPYMGVRSEWAFSVRPDSNATAGPWSFHGRHARDDMLRANPSIDDGTIVSGLAGTAFTWTDGSLTAHGTFGLEAGGFSPRFGGSNAFIQSTLDGRLTFPTFGSQSIRIDGHLVVSGASRLSGDRVSASIEPPSVEVPRQRWVYVGGTGSIPTLDLLERGGDQLFYFDGRYNIPLTRISLPLIGSPILSFREILGGADVGRFPSLAQATGLRLAASLVYAEFFVDPVARRGNFGLGITTAR